MQSYDQDFKTQTHHLDYILPTIQRRFFDTQKRGWSYANFPRHPRPCWLNWNWTTNLTLLNLPSPVNLLKNRGWKLIRPCKTGGGIVTYLFAYTRGDVFSDVPKSLGRKDYYSKTPRFSSKPMKNYPGLTKLPAWGQSLVI